MRFRAEFFFAPAGLLAHIEGDMRELVGIRSASLE
jgi:hypothetical protein